MEFNHIPFLPLNRFYLQYKHEIDAIFSNIMQKQNFIMRSGVAEFENKICKILKVKHCISVGSGSDALYIAIKLLKLPSQHEVILAGNTHVSAFNAIIHNNLQPVLVDCNNDYSISTQAIKKHISKQTAAIIIPHIGGHIAKISEIQQITKQYNIPIIEDAAQAFGSQHNKQFAGTIGEIGCFSLHPMKTIGGYGDGGFIVTNNSHLAQQIKIFRNIGQDENHTILGVGSNSRLDNLQAELINFKLQFIKQTLEQKIKHQNIYQSLIKKNIAKSYYTDSEVSNPFYLFVPERRDELREWLTRHNVETYIHWNPLVHQIKSLVPNTICLPNLDILARQMISLPCHESHTPNEIEHIANLINKFYTEN